MRSFKKTLPAILTRMLTVTLCLMGIGISALPAHGLVGTVSEANCPIGEDGEGAEKEVLVVVASRQRPCRVFHGRPIEDVKGRPQVARFHGAPTLAIVGHQISSEVRAPLLI